MKNWNLFALALVLLSLKVYCQDNDNSSKNDANKHMHQISHEELAKIFDSSERDKWQEPDRVIEFLGNIKDKTIVDLGSGSGYFTFRLAAAGAKVIAADIDKEFLQMIEKKRSEFNFDEERIRTIQISENELEIDSNSVDIIFLVNVYHHISDRVNYFRKANEVLAKDGKIVIVDFYKREIPIGPPKNHKISKEKVIDELSQAGYQELDINTELLEYQYIIATSKY